jgi:hypothetical protein
MARPLDRFTQSSVCRVRKVAFQSSHVSCNGHYVVTIAEVVLVISSGIAMKIELDRAIGP